MRPIQPLVRLPHSHIDPNWLSTVERASRTPPREFYEWVADHILSVTGSLPGSSTCRKRLLPVDGQTGSYPGPQVRLGDTENRTRFDFHHRRFCTIAGQDRSFLQNRLTGYAPAESESWPPHRKTRPRSSMCAAFRDSRRDFSFDAHPVLLAVCCPCFFHRACFVLRRDFESGQRQDQGSHTNVGLRRRPRHATSAASDNRCLDVSAVPNQVKHAL